MQAPDFSEDTDLCSRVIKRMQLTGFKPENIAKFTTVRGYVSAVGLPPIVQLPYLVGAFNALFVSVGQPVPNTIRLSLNQTRDPGNWIQDVEQIVLPFILANEEAFFN
ncbi:MAG: hypothetical protein PHN51_12030 [Candidatus Nanopelagicales bacterium]|nr:hypothetical protein [Candidatus Nanopelagicales bacterium]